MKTATKTAIKKVIKFDETNVPGGYCMTGRSFTKKEQLEMAKIKRKYQQDNISKNSLQKFPS